MTEQNPRVPVPSLVLGWKEYIDFPEWGVRRLKAKIDTGARTSAIHVVDYEFYEDADGGLMVKMRLAPHRKEPDHHIIVHTPVLRTVVVTNSGGQKETRPVIETLLRIGPVRKRIEMTATNRSTMLFRMLLGRRAIEGDFLVDVGRAYNLRKRK